MSFISRVLSKVLHGIKIKLKNSFMIYLSTYKYVWADFVNGFFRGNYLLRQFIEPNQMILEIKYQLKRKNVYHNSWERACGSRSIMADRFAVPASRKKTALEQEIMNDLGVVFLVLFQRWSYHKETSTYCRRHWELRMLFTLLLLTTTPLLQSLIMF